MFFEISLDALLLLVVSVASFSLSALTEMLDFTMGNLSLTSALESFAKLDLHGST